MKFIDISPLISKNIAVFPGDTPFQSQVDLTISDSCSVRLSHINTTVHLGAHADAPNHYDAKGEDIAERDLTYYYGDCQVISVLATKPHSLISMDDIAGITISAARVLFKTNSVATPNQWADDFSALSPELIDYLAQQGVMLIGIDTPSIDPASSKLLEAHQRISAHDMAILEGLVLKHVTAGHYQLVALPLKIAGADASPVRAVLIPM